jgi:hypothetical protein
VPTRREARSSERKQQYDGSRDRGHKGTSLHLDPPNETTISTVSGGTLPTDWRGRFACSGHLAITDSGHRGASQTSGGGGRAEPLTPSVGSVNGMFRSGFATFERNGRFRSVHIRTRTHSW